MNAKQKTQLKMAAALLFVAAGLFFAWDAITHSNFYADLERLNMDNHRH